MAPNHQLEVSSACMFNNTPLMIVAAFVSDCFPFWQKFCSWCIHPYQMNGCRFHSPFDDYKFIRAMIPSDFKSATRRSEWSADWRSSSSAPNLSKSSWFPFNRMNLQLCVDSAIDNFQQIYAAMNKISHPNNDSIHHNPFIVAINQFFCCMVFLNVSSAQWMSLITITFWYLNLS